MYTLVKRIKDTETKRISLVEKQNVYYIKKEVKYYDPIVQEKLKQIIIPHTPKLFESYIDDHGWLVTIEEFINQQLLSYYLERHALTSKEAKHILLNLCDSLEVMHQNGLVYRDLKPDNLFYDGNQVTLFDFDISRAYDKEKTQDTILMGTAGYAAPEQYGYGQSDARSDIYALGVLYHELLTKKLPYEIQYEGEGKVAIQAMIAMDPKDRPQNIKEVRQIIQRERYIYHDPWTLPGFRTNDGIHKTIASIMYLLMFTIVGVSEVENSPRFSHGWWATIGYLVIVFFMIVFTLTNYRHIHQRFYLFGNHRSPFLKIPGIIISFCFYTLLMVFAYLGLLNLLFN